MSRSARRAWWLVAPVVAGVLLLSAAQAAFLPVGSALLRAERSLPCPWAWATGQPCPLCGLTTALALALQGRLGEAVAAHVVGPEVVALCVGVLGMGVRRKWRAGKRRGDLTPAAADSRFPLSEAERGRRKARGRR